MAPKSTLVIDGCEITGTGIEISTVYLAVHEAMDDLSKNPRVIFMPIVGNMDVLDDDGDVEASFRNVRSIRIRADSAVSVNIIDDGTISADYVPLMETAHKNFIETFTGQAKASAESRSTASA